MTKHPGAFVVLWLLLLASIVQVSYYCTVLPPRVASGFDWEGERVG